jgi:hypothetical protein
MYCMMLIAIKLQLVEYYAETIVQLAVFRYVVPRRQLLDVSSVMKL